jgi:cytochrome c-type biogenesis protein CcmH
MTRLMILVLSLALLPGVVFGQDAVAGEEKQDLGVNARVMMGSPEGRPLSGKDLDRATEELTSIMRCPVCQGLSVADSPSLSALAMKAEVRELLEAGYTRDQVLVYFEQAYGEFIRLEPKAEGFNLLVWIAPAVALILGVGLLVVRYRKPSETEAEVVEDDLEGDEDLAAFREQVRKEVRG